MATRVKKSVHLRGKSFSAPSTPGRTFLISDGRQMTADSPNREIPMAQEKPAPNYLKPTASSGHDTASSRYAPKSQQQQHPEDPVTAAATARKSLLSTKSMEKPAASPSSLPHKTTSKEKTPIRIGFSLLNPVLSDPKTTTVPEKASKVPTSGRKTLTRAKSFPKSMPKIREVNGSPSIFTGAIKLEQEDKALSIDNWVQGHAARHVSRSPNSNSEGKQGETIEKSDIGKPGAPRVVKVTKKVSAGNGVPRKLKVQQGKELEGEGKVAVGERFRSKRSGEGVEVEVQGKTERENLVLKWKEVKEKDAPPAYNDVIAETATKPATRRNKVKALVGAFESVILLQETESQPSQQEDEVVAKVGRVGQPSQPKPEDQEVNKVGEEDAGRGQPGRMKPKKEVEGGEECAKGGQQRNSNQRRR